ncbi:hypothetical protein TNCT_597191 [Trichonephila clavata]|uniref:Uncharacterized protein n=1 Tax=Trichonephila clavata TaxID=2740835 RepID=A0A8X6LZ41_TRICU|nr:hypothetical protein TNCT_597191 [Trichonephila clavata]
MLSLPNRALLVKLFYLKKNVVLFALPKFHTTKGMKTKNGPISCIGIVKFVKLFEEARPRRLLLVERRITSMKTTMIELVAESSTGSNSAFKFGRILDMSNSSIRRILQGTLHFYP